MAAIIPWITSSHLNLGRSLDEVSHEAWDTYPKFRGDNSPSGEHHLDNFISMYENFNIVEENVVVRLFVHSFEA